MDSLALISPAVNSDKWILPLTQQSCDPCLGPLSGPPGIPSWTSWLWYFDTDQFLTLVWDSHSQLGLEEGWGHQSGSVTTCGSTVLDIVIVHIRFVTLPIWNNWLKSHTYCLMFCMLSTAKSTSLASLFVVINVKQGFYKADLWDYIIQQFSRYH